MLSVQSRLPTSSIITSATKANKKLWSTFGGNRRRLVMYSNMDLK